MSAERDPDATQRLGPGAPWPRPGGTGPVPLGDDPTAAVHPVHPVPGGSWDGRSGEESTARLGPGAGEEPTRATRSPRESITVYRGDRVHAAPARPREEPEEPATPAMPHGWRLIRSLLITPWRTFQTAHDDDVWREAFIALAVSMVVDVVATLIHDGTEGTDWFATPLDALLRVVSLLAGTTLVASLTHLAARYLGGYGTFAPTASLYVLILGLAAAPVSIARLLFPDSSWPMVVLLLMVVAVPAMALLMLREIHGLSTNRAFMAVLAPFVLFMVLAVVAMVVVIFVNLGGPGA